MAKCVAASNEYLFYTFLSIPMPRFECESPVSDSFDEAVKLSEVMAHLQFILKYTFVSYVYALFRLLYPLI